MDVSDGEDVGELVLRGEVRRKFHGGEEGFQLGELEVVHLEAEGVEVGGLVFATLIHIQQRVNTVLVADEAEESLGHGEGFLEIVDEHIVVQGQIGLIG